MPNSCAYNDTVNFVHAGQAKASWLAKTLGGKGQIFEDRGLPGSAVSADITDGWNSVLSHYPGITVVGHFTSEFAPGPAESGVASLLAAYPNVKGVLVQGYLSGAIQAFRIAGKKPVAFASQAYNGPMYDCAKYHAACFLDTDPPFQSAFAVRNAIEVLEHGRVPHQQVIPVGCFETNTVAVPGVTCQQVVIGKNAFANLPAEMALPVSPPWVQPPLTIKEATGT